MPELAAEPCRVSKRVPSSELDGDQGDVEVLPLVVLACHHHVKVVALGGDLHLGHRAHQLAHGLAQALLVLGEDVVVQQALPA